MPTTARTIAVTEEEARRLFLVRAVESEDADTALVTPEERRRATDVARTRAGDDRDYLRARTDLLLPAALRQPALARAERAARWPRWLDGLLPVVALLVGLVAHALDGSRQLNLIVLPLAAMLAWNLIVYLLLGLGMLRGLASRGPARPNRLAAWLERAATRVRDALGTPARVHAVVTRFARDWLGASAALNYSRASRVLHLSAATLALGTIAGMYWEGAARAYRAGWESTLFGPDAAHAIVATLLGPASVLTGIGLPTRADMPALDFAAGNPGVPALPFVHLYAVTALLFIVAPRLLLFGWHASRAALLARRFPLPADNAYLRRLLRERHGGAGRVDVLPYSLTLPDRAQGALSRLLTAALGDGTRVRIHPAIAYGAEEEWLATAAPDTDHLVLLFSLSATPEAENQGALVAALRQRLASGVSLAVLLEEGGFARRQPDPSRLESRRRAWANLLAGHGVRPVAVDLETERADAGALEAALLRAA